MKPISEWTDDELHDYVGKRDRWWTESQLAAEVLRLRGENAELRTWHALAAKWAIDPVGEGQ